MFFLCLDRGLQGAFLLLQRRDLFLRGGLLFVQVADLGFILAHVFLQLLILRLRLPDLADLPGALDGLG